MVHFGAGFSCTFTVHEHPLTKTLAYLTADGQIDYDTTSITCDKCENQLGANVPWYRQVADREEPARKKGPRRLVREMLPRSDRSAIFCEAGEGHSTRLPGETGGAEPRKRTKTGGRERPKAISENGQRGNKLGESETRAET